MEEENQTKTLNEKHHAKQSATAGLELLAAAHKQKNYRRMRRQSSLQLNASSQSVTDLFQEADSNIHNPLGFTGELDKVNTGEILCVAVCPCTFLAFAFCD